MADLETSIFVDHAVALRPRRQHRRTMGRNVDSGAGFGVCVRACSASSRYKCQIPALEVGPPPARLSQSSTTAVKTRGSHTGSRHSGRARDPRQERRSRLNDFRWRGGRTDDQPADMPFRAPRQASPRRAPLQPAQTRIRIVRANARPARVRVAVLLFSIVDSRARRSAPFKPFDQLAIIAIRETAHEAPACSQRKST
jgi:hypothetical protein